MKNTIIALLIVGIVTVIGGTVLSAAVEIKKTPADIQTDGTTNIHYLQEGVVSGWDIKNGFLPITFQSYYLEDEYSQIVSELYENNQTYTTGEIEFTINYDSEGNFKEGIILKVSDEVKDYNEISSSTNDLDVSQDEVQSLEEKANAIEDLSISKEIYSTQDVFEKELTNIFGQDMTIEKLEKMPEKE